MAILVLPLKGQSLIANGGFEEYSVCPHAATMLWLAQPWQGNSIGTPLDIPGTADLIHACHQGVIVGVPQSIYGKHYPHSGKGMAGIGIALYSNTSLGNYEYLKTQLLEPLQAGKKYCFKMWIKYSDTSSHAFDKLGVAFFDYDYKQSDGRIKVKPYFETESNFVLSDTSWALVKFNFIANGLEEYLMIGQFNKYENLVVKRTSNNNFPWVDGAMLYLLDDISLELCIIPTLVIPNVFTPDKNGQYDFFTVTFENIESLSITIFNRWGEEVFNSQNLDFAWDGTSNGSPLAEGVYFVVAEAVGVNGEQLVEKQTLHLFR